MHLFAGTFHGKIGDRGDRTEFHVLGLCVAFLFQQGCSEIPAFSLWQIVGFCLVIWSKGRVTERRKAKEEIQKRREITTLTTKKKKGQLSPNPICNNPFQNFHENGASADNHSLGGKFRRFNETGASADNHNFGGNAHDEL